MEALEVTWGKALAVWWSFLWRILLFAALVAAFAGAFIGIFGASIGDVDTIEAWATVIGYLAALPVSLWAMKAALSRSYNDFIIMLAPRYESIEEMA